MHATVLDMYARESDIIKNFAPLGGEIVAGRQIPGTPGVNPGRGY